MVLLLATMSVAPTAQQGQSPEPTETFTVFLRSRAIGQETLSIARREDGWLLRGSNRLGPPLEVVTDRAEIFYDANWRAVRLTLEGTVRGQPATLRSTFAEGQATNEGSSAGTSSTSTIPVTSEAVVLPNTFLSAYAALSRRLVGRSAGAAFRGYVPPEGEIDLRLDTSASERIDTPREAIAATRYTLTVSPPAPAASFPLTLWSDAGGRFLRLSLPAQGLEVAREDIASAATRTSSFSVSGEESVRVPASGFNLAASFARPAAGPALPPVAILIGGPAGSDRDGTVAGVPVLGQLAAALVADGFAAVRYDQRGVGQSGGRTETATLQDYAEDVRAIVSWVEKQRKQVDRERVALIGWREGAWVALHAAARDKRVGAVVTIAGASTPGSELVLEQQRQTLDRLRLSDSEVKDRIALQQRVNAAVLSGRDWEGVPDPLRKAAETPWFQSLLAFDPARVLRDVRQPLLVVHGALDTEVAPHHAARLAELARARKRQVATDTATVAGANHLLLPAQTGAVDEYATLPDRRVSAEATTAVSAWLSRVLR